MQESLWRGSRGRSAAAVSARRRRGGPGLAGRRRQPARRARDSAAERAPKIQTQTTQSKLKTTQASASAFVPNAAAPAFVPSFALPPAPPAAPSSPVKSPPTSVPSSPKLTATAKEFKPCSPIATKREPPAIPASPPRRIRSAHTGVPKHTIDDLLKLESDCGSCSEEVKRKLGVFGGYRYERSGAGGGSSGAGFGSRDFAQARRDTSKPGFPSHRSDSSLRDRTALGRSHSSTGQLRDRSPIRPKKRPPKEYVKPDWAKKGDDDGDAALSKKANSILNKLTLEKFDRLSTEFCALEFSTLERVAGAVDLIVTKAQTESHFVSVYASLCVKLANTPNEALGEDEGSTKKFRRLLLERCQAEFERDHSQTIAELESLDEESRERKLAKIRKQYIGHMFFIGALYKQGLLKENIMHHCVQELFGDPSEPDSEKLECLAKLLTSIGKKLDAAALDKKESAKFMKAYFKQLKKLENNKSLDARLRFALKDLRELRENTWVPRRKVEEAKTIQEIHDDIQVRVRRPSRDRAAAMASSRVHAASTPSTRHRVAATPPARRHPAATPSTRPRESLRARECTPSFDTGRGRQKSRPQAHARQARPVRQQPDHYQ
jgi:hypothetical protein